ncbi:MAG: hypothetical protein ABR541_02350 [Candidatus Dormibacteria bacterium]
MSRANRRSEQERAMAGLPTGEQRSQQRGPVVGAPGSTRAGGTISWRSVLVGLGVGEALLLVISNGGLLVSNLAFGGSDRADGGIVGMASFLAVIAGAYLAARLAKRFGLYQGIWVAVGFIIVGAITQYLHEQHLVQLSLQSGSHRLVDLGSMNMGGLFSGDLLALFGGSFGGWLGDSRSRELSAQGAGKGSRPAG